ncbi:chemotaxis response regulator protein-glutamate methylesterase [Pelotomaculum terephthalicicum JT]|uniref:protein-glutamate methylesterase/protein-glutamine glutaminase n=1 Tax=Pelotomaculum TaxID=191373 RepID=UPI0009D60C46|nr:MULTISPECIES: chemotaxis response regulator protein-glutamate methylesterase [Pelotomaculum]MCG9968007.1 chemotaxis response regulator protein-glutamate methylesterase [Pelotomaculum terephthalicicum JT]OPX88608.1 MAG: Chemotaxis response regulator protein-glutamate methylesterase [Pelotomaculum sp. PtaB.Bin117]OPY60816.1 MAG: Chemotaxis response regulator protein-glutamate methylesterase [Pelotomaculum sp. PtaU1.Bin065]
MPPAKVLVVDDSALMRQLISKMLGNYKDIRVIGTAVNGQDALDKIKALEPDVVTLDVEMPVLDGLAALRRIMRECPLPVIMCSTLTSLGTRATIEALTFGALDFVTKPTGPSKLNPMVEELAGKIKVAVAVPLSRFTRRPLNVAGPLKPKPAGVGGTAADSGRRADRPAPAAERGKPVLPAGRFAGRTRIVVIGCSTGGPAALQQVVPVLPRDFPVPVVVVQHIPAGFSKPLAEHLDRKSHLEVRHAEDGDLIKAGRVLVAPAGFDLTFRDRGGSVAVVLDKGSAPLPPGGFRPSVDGVMTSAARMFGDSTVGVLMTGMGRDGARGMKEIKNYKGRTIAEAESSCVVYGMPRAAVEAGAADRVTPLPQIAQEIINII